MIYEDIAGVVAVALFIWLVPVRRNGIPGLRGRGKLPEAPPPLPPEQPAGHPAPAAEGATAPEQHHDEPSGFSGSGGEADQAVPKTARPEPSQESAKRASY
jgi:hypothetical protein